MNVIEGKYVGEKKSFTIIASRFNEFIVARLIEGAVDCLTRHGVTDDAIELVRVPGAWEIPGAASAVLNRKKLPHAVICLGAVIRGETPHFDFVAAEVSKGIAQLGLHHSLPVVYGVVTADSVDQAIDRAGSKQGNRGWDAALSALELSDLYARLK